MPRAKKRLIRASIVVLNLILLFGVVNFVVNAETSSTSTHKLSLGQASEGEELAVPLDQVSSADIAVNVARMTRMAESTSVTNHADSVNATFLSPQADNSVVVKPVVMATSLPTKYDIQEYHTKEGDTISSIADVHGVSSDAVRWSNGLTGNSIDVDTTIYLPPAGVSGLVYVVEEGDTPESIADKFNSSQEKIISFNDAEISGLVPGERIVIPDGSRAAPRPNFAFAGYNFVASYGFNGYDYGWCTWYTANRRIEIGRPVPANLGDAYTWVARGRLAGLPVTTEPRVGSVIWSNTYYPGHVGFVEEVNADGSIWVTDMNSHGQVSKDDPTFAGGWNRISWRLVTPDKFGGFLFID